MIKNALSDQEKAEYREATGSTIGTVAGMMAGSSLGIHAATTGLDSFRKNKSKTLHEIVNKMDDNYPTHQAGPNVLEFSKKNLDLLNKRNFLKREEANTVKTIVTENPMKRMKRSALGMMGGLAIGGIAGSLAGSYLFKDRTKEASHSNIIGEAFNAGQQDALEKVAGWKPGYDDAQKSDFMGQIRSAWQNRDRISKVISKVEPEIAELTKMKKTHGKSGHILHPSIAKAKASEPKLQGLVEGLKHGRDRAKDHVNDLVNLHKRR